MHAGMAVKGAVLALLTAHAKKQTILFAFHTRRSYLHWRPLDCSLSGLRELLRGWNGKAAALQAQLLAIGKSRMSCWI